MSVIEIKVPSPGESISEVQIANWVVKSGDFVQNGQVIAEIDSDKATLEMTAEASGEKVLIFSQSLHVLAAIETMLLESAKSACNPDYPEFYKPFLSETNVIR